ncbi:glycosyltransferase family 9 protein [Inquilinus sp. KBS0705]|nr:glycosyltransferase family 9 protein [Inquilinus sp. KBS0705]
MKLPPSEIKKIAIFRSLQLGDMLCAIPAIRALRHAYPDAEIILIGLPWAKSFTERFANYFNGFVQFAGYPGLPEQPFNPEAFTTFLSAVQKEKFDLAIQMQGNGSIINPMIELLGAKYVAGYTFEGHYAPDNDLFMPYPDYGHEIDRHLLLMGFLGIEAQGVELEYPLTTADYDSLEQLKLDIEPKKYICIHPGSRGGWRQWPVQYFASLSDYCIEQGFKAVLTGTNDEATIINDVIKHMRYTPINAAGKTSMGAIGALIQNAAMLISNCTGVSHIASAFKTPSIVISMDGEPQRWGPLDKRVHRTINWLQSPDFHSVFRETVELVSLAS